MFDMDGVITRTARVHAAAWKQLFDEYLASRLARGLPAFQPFDDDVDYREHVDGRPRFDGVQAFLQSRGISLPWGTPDDPPEFESVSGLGNRYIWAHVHRDGVDAYPSTVVLIRELRAARVRTGAFSASKNAAAILDAAGVLDLFDERVDGVLAEQLGLPGKPAPAMLLELARASALRLSGRWSSRTPWQACRQGEQARFGLSSVSTDRRIPAPWSRMAPTSRSPTCRKWPFRGEAVRSAAGPGASERHLPPLGRGWSPARHGCGRV